MNQTLFAYVCVGQHDFAKCAIGHFDEHRRGAEYRRLHALEPRAQGTLFS